MDIDIKGKITNLEKETPAKDGYICPTPQKPTLRDYFLPELPRHHLF